MSLRPAAFAVFNHSYPVWDLWVVNPYTPELEALEFAQVDRTQPADLTLADLHVMAAKHDAKVVWESCSREFAEAVEETL